MNSFLPKCNRYCILRNRFHFLSSKYGPSAFPRLEVVLSGNVRDDNPLPSRSRLSCATSEEQTIEALKKLLRKWQADEVSRRAAALAFYGFLSLAPLLIIVVSLLGLVYGEAEAQQRLLGQAESAVGETAASALRTILDNTDSGQAGIAGLVIGWALMFFGASRAFAELQADLNVIWGVGKQALRRGLVITIIKRLLTFAAILGVGLLLLLSMLVSALIAGFAERLSENLPAPGLILQVSAFVAFLVVLTPIIAMLFKLLPQTTVRWKDLWLGAAFTAVLFSIGKLGIGLYLGRSASTSAFGAAGAFVVLLLWIYYSALILLLGAELTWFYATRREERDLGSPIAAER
jgi:membrane protein